MARRGKIVLVAVTFVVAAVVGVPTALAARKAWVRRQVCSAYTEIAEAIQQGRYDVAQRLCSSDFDPRTDVTCYDADGNRTHPKTLFGVVEYFLDEGPECRSPWVSVSGDRALLFPNYYWSNGHEFLGVGFPCGLCFGFTREDGKWRFDGRAYSVVD